MRSAKICQFSDLSFQVEVLLLDFEIDWERQGVTNFWP